MGKLLILGGPSCSGKTSIKNKIVSMFPIKFKKLITVTTRPERLNETHGEDYYFLSDYEFDWRLYREEFVEHNEYTGMKYGVLKESIDHIKNHHSITVAVMDLNGVKKMKEYLGKENVVSVYVDVSEQTINNRLKDRGESKEEIKKRIEKAISEEMTPEYKNNFDFIIENEKQTIESSVFQIIDSLIKKHNE